MKVCPKCGSVYYDETLNFCLSDGEPLGENTTSSHAVVVEPEDWRDAETLIDPRLEIDENTRRTLAGNAGNTSQTSRRTTSSNSFLHHKTRMYLLSGVAVCALLTVGLFLYTGSRKNGDTAGSAQPPATANRTATTAKQPVNLSADEQEQIKKEVAETLENWRKSIESRDLDKHLEFYANTLDFFYKDSNINKNYVRAARARAYEIYPSISLQIDKLKVTPESETSAVAVFDKDWTFKNPQKTSTGSVQQEIHLSKQNGKWLITAEKDLEVHFINNRSEDANNQNTATNVQP